MIKGLHHNAYRCRDSEESRAFYEDFLGLPLVGTLEVGESKTGRPTQTLHTFYRLDDGSHLACFECRELPFAFKKQHDFATSTCTSRWRSPQGAAAHVGKGPRLCENPVAAQRTDP